MAVCRIECACLNKQDACADLVLDTFGSSACEGWVDIEPIEGQVYIKRAEIERIKAWCEHVLSLPDEGTVDE
jgi:hypothetical protein